MAHTVVLTDVPAQNVDQVVEDFESEGATVSKTQQPNGAYTVTATFPDAAAAAKVVSSKHGTLQHALLTFKRPIH